MFTAVFAAWQPISEMSPQWRAAEAAGGDGAGGGGGGVLGPGCDWTARVAVTSGVAGAGEVAIAAALTRFGVQRSFSLELAGPPLVAGSAPPPRGGREAAGRLVVAGPVAMIGGASILASRWESAGAAAVVLLAANTAIAGLPQQPAFDGDDGGTIGIPVVAVAASSLPTLSIATAVRLDVWQAAAAQPPPPDPAAPPAAPAVALVEDESPAGWAELSALRRGQR
eukprot:SAG22_NODE_1295_length_4835_cov_3.235431_1_plen_225_part_00